MSILNDLKNALALIDQLAIRDERKSIPRILYEVMQLAVLNRNSPSYYFSRHLYRKDRTNIHDYVPNRILYDLSVYFNDDFAAQILSNKLFFGLFFDQFKINVPKILMYNHKNAFIADNTVVEINTIDAFRDLLVDLIQKKSAHNSVFIKKTYDSYGGSNIFKLSGNEIPWNHQFLLNLYHEITQSSYLFQDTIQQHPELEILNPSCVNTIRLDTFIDQHGKPEIVSAYLRMSINNLHVDNISSGGCCVGVELSTGKLKKFGYTSYTKAGGKIMIEHPITKISFEDFTIPSFHQAKELLLKVAVIVPSLRLIGWDIAIGNNGPVLIEGNCGYDMTLNDLTYGGFRKNPVFKKILDEVKSNRK